MLTKSCNSADNRTIVSHYQFLWKKTHKNESCIYMFRAGVPGCFPPRSTLRSFPLISFISASLKCNSDCSDCTCGKSSISVSSCETFHRDVSQACVPYLPGQLLLPFALSLSFLFLQGELGLPLLFLLLIGQFQGVPQDSDLSVLHQDLLLYLLQLSVNGNADT